MCLLLFRNYGDKTVDAEMDVSFYKTIIVVKTEWMRTLMCVLFYVPQFWW